MSAYPGFSDAIPPYPGDTTALDRYERGGCGFACVAVPDHTFVVLGRATPISDVIVEACAKDGVPLYRRRGGGGAVVLSPGMLVITCCFGLSVLPDVQQLTCDLSAVAARVLSSLASDLASDRDHLCSPPGFGVRGFGDVCIGDRKVLGSSLYIRRGAGLYQASLLVRDCAAVVSRYLAHPSREPSYRAGRPHSAFITSLEEHGFSIGTAELAERIRRGYDSWLGRGGTPNR